jgi:GNAT superfamily N-acetyltransferase
MNEVNVRRAAIFDIPYMYDICLKTGSDGADATDQFFDPYMIGHYYAAPYLFYKDGICFVAECQYRAQGYIIAVPDTVAYNQWLEEKWLPPLRKQYSQPYPQELIRSNREAWILGSIHAKQFPMDMNDVPWLAGYPAHLHIDMLPVLQGKGLGRTLMDTLFTELKNMGVSGIHLGVSAANKGATGFYQKLGFSVLKEFDWGCQMGKLI